MSQVVLKQSGASFPEGSGIDFACGMTDQNSNSQSVDLNLNNNSLKFNGYGPSIGTLSNVVLTPPTNPTSMTFNVSGTGNLPGKPNAPYTGNGSWSLSWSYNEFTHQYQVTALKGLVTLNY